MREKGEAQTVDLVAQPQPAKPDGVPDMQKRAAQREIQRVRNADARTHARSVLVRRKPAT